MNLTGTGTAPAKSPDTSTERNTLLLVGGYFSLAFAAFQISAVFWSPNAIKYLGGPAELSKTRPVIYALLCIAVAAIVAVFGLYALSGAGKIRRQPLLRTILTITTLIYVLRGLLLIPQLPIVIRQPGLIRFAAFSVISLCAGFVHLGGLIKLLKRGHPGIAASNHRS
jgi:putative oxidoreductase